MNSDELELLYSKNGPGPGNLPVHFLVAPNEGGTIFKLAFDVEVLPVTDVLDCHSFTIITAGNRPLRNQVR